MPKSENQKFKSLYVAKYLWENADENHDFTAEDIKQHLKDEYNITAERRSIYRDLEALQEVWDFDIEGKRGGHYHLMSRPFEFDDLRLIAECIDAAKFISADRAKWLVKLLSTLCSQYQSDQLMSETFLCNRVKTTQKNVLNNINEIRAAMSARLNGEPHTPSKITFKYLKHDIKDLANQKERRKGELYKVSPYKLMINDGNYYLISYDDKVKDIRTYRIDRMKDVREIGEEREGAQEFARLDIEHYTKQVFSMYGGKEELVNIRFIPKLLDTFVERFGTGGDVKYTIQDENHYVVSTHVAVSDQFYGWLCGFGKGAKIIYPPSAVEKFKDYVDKISSMY